MRGHGLTQMHDPALVILGIDFIRGGEARPDLGWLVRFRQVPQQGPVVEVVADKAVPLETLVGISGCDRDVARGQRDSQRSGGPAEGRRGGSKLRSL